MPKRTRSTTRRGTRPYKRRSFRKRRSSYKKRATIGRSLSTPIPDRMFTRLKYSEQVSVTTGVTCQWYSFRLNNVYDPNYTGTGHQPLGFDQWNTFYNKYQVTKAYFRVHPISQTSNTEEVGYHINHSTTTPSGVELAKEKPFSRWMLIGDSDVSSQKSLRGYAYPAKILGISYAKYRMDDNYSGACNGTSSPAGVYLHIGVQNANRTGVDAVLLNVDIMFHTVFYDRVALSMS